jgi:hypothetical protein
MGVRPKSYLKTGHSENVYMDLHIRLRTKFHLSALESDAYLRKYRRTGRTWTDLYFLLALNVAVCAHFSALC